jgi:allophanate hydrolase subunit 2
VERIVHAELPSEGLVRGAIQVPPDGDPVMMLADHPTTGGYPVIAVVHPDDVAIVAQRHAGRTVRLRLDDRRVARSVGFPSRGSG